MREGRELVAVWAGFKERVYGLAIDVGTTTIAGHLCNLESGEVVASSGMMNPQIRFGEDLMSRISYLQQNERQAPALTAAVQGAIRELAAAVAAEAGIDREDIVEAALVGNPTMHHLVLGIDPTQLGMEPFPARGRSRRDGEGARPLHGHQPRCLRVLPAVHRGARGRGYRRSHPLPGPAPPATR